MHLQTDERDWLFSLSFLEQVHAGLQEHDKLSIVKARSILEWVAENGDAEMLAQVFRGIVLTFDLEQQEWDAMPS